MKIKLCLHWISFLYGIYFKIVETSDSTSANSYVDRKLQSIASWLDSRKESTIFDYIYNVNYGMGLNLFQGDIKGYNPRHRTAVRDHTYLWNTRVIPYVFDPSFNSEAKQDVMQAIAEYNAKTCIRFIPRTDQQDYLNFKHISGCYSNIGRQGGMQEVSLMKPCLRKGTAIHEIMHSLGFWHEQSRPDRDSWIQVIFANIEKGKEFNFDKLSVDEVDTLGVQYDYGSIMHYSKYSFSKNGNPTILPIRNSNVEIGQRDGLSPLDIQRINTLYRCDIPDTKPTTQQPTTQRQTTPQPTKPTPMPTQSPPSTTTPVLSTQKPTIMPTPSPPSTTTTVLPTQKPSVQPTNQPTTKQQTPQPLTQGPTSQPTQMPVKQPTTKITLAPTEKPTVAPTQRPTVPPVGWSSWSSFTPCNLQCRRQRYRFCLNTNIQYCPGSNLEKEICGPPCKPASYLGCWKIDLFNISIPSVEGLYPTLTDNFQSRTAAVRKCADVASIRGNAVFALYNYGMCLTGPNAVKTFSQYGSSSDCGYRGKGGATGISVYSFQNDIDGQYGMWTDWGQCTRTCGGGQQYRYRQCNNPPPIGNGAACKGADRESRKCNEDRCNADAKCGMKYHMGDPGTSGIINLLNYDNYMTCDYKIETGKSNSTISLLITRLDIEYSRGCFYDVLSIFDGADKYANPIGDFCGNQRPIPFESSGNSLYISFESDATTTAKGYTIEYMVNSRTRKACTELQQPGHSVMIGTSNFAGDSVSFVCDPGYKMQGSSRLTCVDQAGFAIWSDAPPFCFRRFKRGADEPLLSECDFEGNLCGYKNEDSDDLDWLVKRYLDENNNTAHHLQTSSAKYQLPGDTATIRSKVLECTGFSCLRFSYRIYGNDSTQLHLYIDESSRERKPQIWTATSNDIDIWAVHETQIFTHDPFSIAFKYIVGESIYSSAELDNITIRKGQC